MNRNNRLNISQMVALSVRPAALIMLLFLLVAGTVAAQSQGRGRPWKRGELRLEDFGVTPYDGRTASFMDCGINYHLDGVTEGRDTYLYCRTAAVMFPLTSWIAEGHRDTAELLYNQVQFDLVEIYRRQMQRQSYLLKKGRQYAVLRENTMAELERELEVMRYVTDRGHDSVALARYNRKNHEWLNTNPGTHPTFTKGVRWWCIGLEVGFAFSTGTLNDLITPSIGSTGFMGGFGWGRHGIYMRTTNAECMSRDSLMDYTGMFGIQTMLRHDISLLSYGYTVIDRPDFSVTPYLSYGITDIQSMVSWYSGDCYTFGVMGLYHFHHWHSIRDGAKGKARCFTPSASANLSVSYVDMGWDTRGLTVSLQLGLVFGSRAESVEW